MTHLTRKQHQFRHHLKTAFLGLCSLILVGLIPGALNEDLIFKVLLRHWYPEQVANFNHPLHSLTSFLLWIIPFLLALSALLFVSFKTVRHLKKAHIYQISKPIKTNPHSVLFSMPDLSVIQIQYKNPTYFLIAQHNEIAPENIKALIAILTKNNSDLAKFFINLDYHLDTLKTLHLFYEYPQVCNGIDSKITMFNQFLIALLKNQSIKIINHKIKENTDIHLLTHMIIKISSNPAFNDLPTNPTIIDISTGSKQFAVAAALSTLNNDSEFSLLDQNNIPYSYPVVHQSEEEVTPQSPF